ncbi:hypothetical protein GCM10029976_039860 [Kribbella albertanoniae]
MHVVATGHRCLSKRQQVPSERNQASLIRGQMNLGAVDINRYLEAIFPLKPKAANRVIFWDIQGDIQFNLYFESCKQLLEIYVTVFENFELPGLEWVRTQPLEIDMRPTAMLP